MTRKAWCSLLLLALSCLPLAPWLWARQADEPCALLLAPLFLTLRKPPVALDLRLAAFLLTVAAGFSAWLPLLARAVLVSLALGSLLSSWRCARLAHPALLGLCLLSLPGMASGQFLLGYPLRRVASLGSACLLQGCGYKATVEGVALRWQDQLVLVDEPCSGLKMAWVGLAVVCLLALRRHWADRHTLTWLALAAGGAVLANCWRGAALFLVSRHSTPAWAHELTGICAFAVTVGALVWLSPPEQKQLRNHGPIRGWLPFLGSVLLNLVPWPVSETKAPSGPVVWPTRFEGKKLREIAQSDEEKRYYANFPGRMGRFSDGHREIILRHLQSPTRRLHPSADCFRGLGYQIKDDGLWRDEAGKLWHRFHANKGAHRLLVRERIYSARRSWTDLSEWYWTAGTGPWWSVCVAESP